MAAFLRGARVAALPVAMGTGTPNKLFEALEAGAAVVASEDVVTRASDGDRPPARSARTDAEFASAVVALLEDPDGAAAEGRRGRAWVEAHADRRRSIEALAAGYREARGRG
jgi:glycosyltransferase involved in cell wall biosynthesis